MWLVLIKMQMIHSYYEFLVNMLHWDLCEDDWYLWHGWNVRVCLVVVWVFFSKKPAKTTSDSAGWRWARAFLKLFNHFTSDRKWSCSRTLRSDVTRRKLRRLSGTSQNDKRLQPAVSPNAIVSSGTIDNRGHLPCNELPSHLCARAWRTSQLQSVCRSWLKRRLF